MAVPFVPVPFPVDWTGACRSRTKRGSPMQTILSVNCEPSPTESFSWVRGVGRWVLEGGASPTDNSWSRSQPDMFDGSHTLLEGEGSHGDSWTERPIALTLLGYEILEERAKFTAYKILVTEGGGHWVIFRRYTDFCRLNDKLKELFPSFGQALPPKRWFRDNYEEEFLEERQIGLQTFLQNLTLRKDVISSEAVGRFLCLVDPPSPFDSLEESRDFCETLEKTNHRLQRELLENQREIDSLKKMLEKKEKHISLLVKKVKSLSLSPAGFMDTCQPTAADTNTDTDVNEFEKKLTGGNEAEDNSRGCSITGADSTAR